MAKSEGSEKRFVASCPVCGEALRVVQLECGGCSTQIQTSLPVPGFLRLPLDLQHFVRVFLACRGNISEVEKRLGISYPTVNKRLDVVNAVLQGSELPATAADTDPPAPPTRRQVLQQLENGEINAQQAARLLKQLSHRSAEEE